MPLAPQGVAQVPNFWNVYGHSYFMHAFGTRTQAGRADSLFRNLLNVDHTSFANLAATGSRLTQEGNSAGGYVRLLQNVAGFEINLGSAFTAGFAPYVAGGGAYLLAWGINDLGVNTNTAQANSAYAQAMRMAISRCRMSSLRDDDYSGAAGTGTIAYGAGFTSNTLTYEIASGNTTHSCTTTGANATVTITLPSDYNGETVTLSFLTIAGVNGGVVTFTGTAGVTGTLSLSNILPAAAATHSPVVQRITNLTSANASQTIIITVTSLDAGGTVTFDGFWLEAKNPPPVLVCNTARLLTAGYAGYFGGMGDSDVVTFNAALYPVIAEFDGMVQVVDIDSALNKDTTKFGADGLHPNELGAAAISDAILAAVRRLPANKWGVAAAIQPPSPRTAAVVVPVINGQWYTSQSMGGPNGTAYTAVAGDVWAIPFEVTSGISRWTQWSVELITSTVATTVLMCVYDDRRYAGYPQTLYQQPANTAGTPLSLATGAGAKLSTTTSGANGYLSAVPDPGLYWLVLKIITAGTTTFRTCKGPSLWMPNMSAGAGGVAPCGWKVTGLGATALPGTFPQQALFSATAADNAPMIGLLIG